MPTGTTTAPTSPDTPARGISPDPGRRVAVRSEARSAMTVEAGPEARPAAATDGGDRDAYLDNVKALAIILVVVGHTVRPFLDAPGAAPLYLWIYTFHMPVFILVSGYLARSWTGTPDRMRKLFTTLVVPYLVFQLIFQVELDLAAGRPIGVDLANPEFALWFILSLAFWRITSPLVRQLRWPVAVAVGVSLAAGLDDSLGETLSLGRTFALFPFFVAGMYLRREHFERLARPAVRWTAAVVAAGWFLAMVVLRDDLPLSWFYWRSGYHDLGLRWSQGLVMRASAIVVATVLSAAVLALVPRRRSLLTTLGAGTMYAYLLHGLVLLPMRSWNLFAGVDTFVEVVGVVLAAVGFAVLLLSPTVRRATRLLVELPAGARMLRPTANR